MAPLPLFRFALGFLFWALSERLKVLIFVSTGGARRCFSFLFFSHSAAAGFGDNGVTGLWMDEKIRFRDYEVMCNH